METSLSSSVFFPSGNPPRSSPPFLLHEQQLPSSLLLAPLSLSENLPSLFLFPAASPGISSSLLPNDSPCIQIQSAFKPVRGRALTFLTVPLQEMASTLPAVSSFRRERPLHFDALRQKQ
ncbi:hypothetical protein HPP92_023723 [Vanilla planifolia]|uniref:Uncharacterized protein n=1 Tax=Vanilla planifolia TaxID=51239 RepID=A0A835UCA0_VANPL|nr:hypothetical protein HPP92_024065 [Vanilla planifolia]KAG0455935.1 hypothetical protein HPP92_023723 [Vanilla planifolia]